MACDDFQFICFTDSCLTQEFVRICMPVAMNTDAIRFTNSTDSAPMELPVTHYDAVNLERRLAAQCRIAREPPD